MNHPLRPALARAVLAFTALWTPISSLSLGSQASLPVPAEMGTVAEPVVLAGKLECIDSQSVDSTAPEMISHIAVTVGQRVKKGDLLAEVDTSALKWQLQYLQAHLSIVRGQLDQARIDEKYDQNQVARTRGLASKDIVSRSKVETSEMKVLDTKIRRIRMEKDYDTVVAQIKKVEEQARKTNFYVPMDGVITELFVNPKQVVGSVLVYPGTRIARVESPGRYLIRALAMDTQVRGLKLGQEATVYFDGMAEPIKARLSSIGLSSVGNKDELHYFDVNLSFEKPGEMLRRGLLGRIELQPRDLQPVLSLPWNSIQLEPNHASVRVADPKAGWREKVVTLGLRGNSRVEITSGLDSGEITEAALW